MYFYAFSHPWPSSPMFPSMPLYPLIIKSASSRHKDFKRCLSAAASFLSFSLTWRHTYIDTGRWWIAGVQHSPPLPHHLHQRVPHTCRCTPLIHLSLTRCLESCCQNYPNVKGGLTQCWLCGPVDTFDWFISSENRGCDSPARATFVGCRFWFLKVTHSMLHNWHMNFLYF